MSAPSSRVTISVIYDDDIEAGADALLAVLRPPVQATAADERSQREDGEPERDAAA